MNTMHAALKVQGHGVCQGCGEHIAKLPLPALRPDAPAVTFPLTYPLPLPP